MIYAILTESIRDRQTIDRSTQARTHSRAHIHAFVFCTILNYLFTVCRVSCTVIYTQELFMYGYLYFIMCVYVYFVYTTDWHFAHRKRKHFKLSFRCFFVYFNFFVLDLFKSSWAIAYVTKEGVGRNFINCKHLATDSNVHILFEVLWFSHVNDEYAKLRFLKVMCN